VDLDLSYSLFILSTSLLSSALLMEKLNLNYYCTQEMYPKIFGGLERKNKNWLHIISDLTKNLKNEEQVIPTLKQFQIIFENRWICTTDMDTTLRNINLKLRMLQGTERKYSDNLNSLKMIIDQKRLMISAQEFQRLRRIVLNYDPQQFKINFRKSKKTSQLVAIFFFTQPHLFMHSNLTIQRYKILEDEFPFPKDLKEMITFYLDEIQPLNFQQLLFSDDISNSIAVYLYKNFAISYSSAEILKLFQSILQENQGEFVTSTSTPSSEFLYQNSDILSDNRDEALRISTLSSGSDGKNPF
jgi:hypothetical protein